MFNKNKSQIKKITDENNLNRNIFLKELPTFISRYNNIVFVGHISPDGDSLGCIHGLREVIKQTFPTKKTFVIGSDNDLFSWLNMEYDVLPAELDISKSMVVILDTSVSSRIQEFNNHFKADKKWGAVVVIDHHNSTPDFSTDLVWIDPTYSSSCGQVLQMCDYFCWNISKKAATFFYLGLVTDSNYFGYSSTLPRTLILAAKALRYGADQDLIFRNLTNRTFAQIKAQKFMLDIVKKENKFLWLHLTKDIIDQHHIVYDPNTVNILSNIEDNEVWMLFTDAEDGKIKAEFRSLHIPIRDLAVEFGGGGHDNAAGCVLSSPSQIKVVVNAAKKYIATKLESYASEQATKNTGNQFSETVTVSQNAIEQSQSLKDQASVILQQAKDNVDKIEQNKTSEDTTVEPITTESNESITTQSNESTPLAQQQDIKLKIKETPEEAEVKTKSPSESTSK